MKPKEKKMILLLIGITIVVTVIAIIMNNSSQEEKQEITKADKTVELQEKNVKVLEDGTKLNTSNKLKQSKKINGLEISNLQLTEKNNVSVLLGTVKNVTDTKQGGYRINVKIVDEQGNEIITVGAIIGELEPGETTEFNTSATFDYANAYDFTVSEK